MEIERSIENIHLTQEQLLELVQKSFPNCDKLDDWKILSGGALNTTYQFQIGSSAFVLRLYARDRSHCKTEIAIHSLINGSVSTPKLIYANDSHKPWAYSIFEFVDGCHISQVAEEHKTTLSFELGKILASIHSFKFLEAGLFGEGIAIGHPFKIDSSPYFEETYSVLSKSKDVRARLGEKLADTVVVFIQKNKEFFPIVQRDNVCLTHSDFKPVNLLYQMPGKIFVLDWEFAHAGIGILDFAILLRHRKQFPLDINALRNGYTSSGGYLPIEWLRSALITDFVNIVTLLEQPGERLQLFHQLRDIVQTTIKDWESIENLSP